MVEGEESEPTALSLLLKGLMDETGLDVGELAKRSGLGVSTIYAYLHGRARGERPRPGTFEALARGLAVDPNLFYLAAERGDAHGERRLITFFRTIPNQQGRTEAIDAVRAIAHRYRRRNGPPNG